MAAISADMVKELRERTGAGLMDCKHALAESNGDLEKAIEALRKAGIAKQAKRAGKSASEGRLAFVVRPDVGVMVEFLCETDFVAKTDRFLAYTQELAEHAANNYKGSGNIAEQMQETEKNNILDMVNKTGENVQFRRILRWETQNSVVGHYLHHDRRLGVLVEVEGPADAAYLNQLGMQIAAQNPRYVDPSQIPADVLAKEREIIAAQPDMKGKPAAVLDKIVDGRLQKWYAESCLTKQPWLFDEKLTVEKVNPKVKIKRFERWQVGEGLAN